MKKRFASFILAAMMAVSFGSVTASAEYKTVEPSALSAQLENDGYFCFTDSSDRMSSDGSFTFEFSNGLQSDSFIAQDTELVLIINNSSISTPGSQSANFTVTLYHYGILSTKVQSETCRVGKSYYFTFTNLKKGDTYFLQFYNESISSTNAKIKGSGSISPIKLK